MEINSGLNDGDQVIYAGHESLKEGDAVVPTKWGPSGPLSLPPATGEAAPGTVYTCPMHPEVKSDQPGDCPQCGMKLQPVAPTAPGSGSSPSPEAAPSTPASKKSGSYYCPMHPEVKGDKPGKCPKCGMDLQPAPTSGPRSSPAATGYYCPMDPEVKSSKPGKCPKCGMDLQPVPKKGSAR